MTDQPLEPRETEQPSEPEPEAVTEVKKAPPRPEPAERRLRRSRDDRVIAGVCGGLGEYFGVDPVLIRIAAVILVFAGGAGALLYVVGWIAIPEESEEGEPEPPAWASEPSERTKGAIVLGLVFIALGAFFLLDELWPDFLSWRYVWPIALIAIGVAILFRQRR